MKAQATKRPPDIEDLGKQKRFNFNVQEIDTDDGTIFEYEFVVCDNNRDSLITALIRRKYTTDKELALINNYQDGEQEHIDEYNEYQSYRIECKTIANQFFQQ
ncbi:hypothetical protein ACT29H_09435 [Thermophagus sp. OGC60D27]|uniref:hypothetical protein n=1 Tax=Thermophagus sp. OGC60D27 TaxID=3458415 RepID=UPI004038413A